MISVLLTFYLLVGGGYLLKRLGIFRETDISVFVNFIIYFALPITVLGVIHDVNFSIKDAAVFLTAWVCVALTFLVVYLPLKRRLDEKTSKVLFLSSAFGNTAFVGYPVAYTLLGDKGLAYAILFDTVGNFFLVITFGIFLITGRIEWKTLFKFPPLGALLLAFLTKRVPLGIFGHFVSVVKGAITPTVVFALGLRFNPKAAFKNLKWALFAIFWRQLVVPAVVLVSLLILSQFLALSKTEKLVILLQSSMPPFVMAAILAEKFRLNTDLAIAAANGGILFLLVTLPLWFYLGNHLLG